MAESQYCPKCPRDVDGCRRPLDNGKCHGCGYVGAESVVRNAPVRVIRYVLWKQDTNISGPGPVEYIFDITEWQLEGEPRKQYLRRQRELKAKHEMIERDATLRLEVFTKEVT